MKGKKYKVIMVSNHKTSTTGRAKITVAWNISHFLEEYVKKVRPQIAAKSIYLIPNLKEKSLDHLSRHIQIPSVSIALNTSCLGRHAAVTAAVCRGSEMQQNAVSMMMSHSAVTQKLIYADNKGASEVVEGFRAMEGLRGTEGQGSPRKRFSNPQVNNRKLYFNATIAAGEVRTIGQCRAYVGDHKSEKQVGDKLRNIIGRKAGPPSFLFSVCLISISSPFLSSRDLWPFFGDVSVVHR